MSSLRSALGRRYRRAAWIARRQGAKLRWGARQVEAMPIVFANAVPKGGSNLLFNILRGLTAIGPFVDSGQPVIKPYIDGKPTPPEWIRKELLRLAPGDVRCGYLYGSEDHLSALLRPGWANFLIVRDPRDQIVSQIFYALEIYKDHALHEHLRSFGSMEERIDVLINGIPEGELSRANVREHYARFLPWVSRPEVCVVRFERLVTEPEAELDRMLEFMQGFGFVPRLGREAAVEKLKERMDPSLSNTYRKGKTGEWRKHFTPANIARFKEVAGELLVQLGYEKDLDW